MCNNYSVNFVETNFYVGSGGLTQDGVLFSRRGLSLTFAPCRYSFAKMCGLEEQLRGQDGVAPAVSLEFA